MDADIEIVNLMIDGGENICDYAITQWIGDKYKMEEEHRRKAIKDWGEKKRRIRPLANILKEHIRSGK